MCLERYRGQRDMGNIMAAATVSGAVLGLPRGLRGARIGVGLGLGFGCGGARRGSPVVDGWLTLRRRSTVFGATMQALWLAEDRLMTPEAHALRAAKQARSAWDALEAMKAEAARREQELAEAKAKADADGPDAWWHVRLPTSLAGLWGGGGGGGGEARPAS